MSSGEINEYACPDCGGKIVTVDRDQGVTPMFLACRATERCKGRMVSRMYRVSEGLVPTWEWYREPITKRMSPEMREHVRRGGLSLRRIGE